MPKTQPTAERFALRDGTKTRGYFDTLEIAVQHAEGPHQHIRKLGMPHGRTVARYTYTGVQVSGAKAPSPG